MVAERRGTYVIDDLGVLATGDANYDHISGVLARHPETGEEYIIHTSFALGFVAVNPRTRESVHVLPVEGKTNRAATQGPDGGIYQICDGKLLRWDWISEHSQLVATFPEEMKSSVARPAAAVDFDHAGRVYAWGYHTNVWRFDMQTGTAEAIARDATAVCNRRDRCVYLLSRGEITCYDPESGTRMPVTMEDGSPCPGSKVIKDADGRCIIPQAVKSEHGRTWWLELVGNIARPVDASEVRLAYTIVGDTDIAQVDAQQNYLSPYVLADRSYVSRILGREITIVDQRGRLRTFSYQVTERPLELFAIEAGGGRVWISAILPLYFLSYDPASGTVEKLGTPTPSAGEMYNLVWSHGRVFYASYPGSFVSRYDPSRPWRCDQSVQANPRQFGRMKDLTGTGAVHRPQGKAIDGQGNIYFASLGDYGCPDSAVSRIDVTTEEMRTWVLPNTMTGALVYVSSTDQLLVAERRGGKTEGGVNQEGVRFTLLSPHTGEVQWSEVMIEDRGDINSWLHVDGDIVYGIHDYRATLFAFDVRQQKIVAELPDLGLGDHCWNGLWLGPDGRVWGLTRGAVFAAERDLSAVEVIATYSPYSSGGYSSFGMGITEDGSVYFVDNTHLRRVRRAR